MLVLVAVVAFDRLRMLWGAVDWQHGAGTPYTGAQTVGGGASAAPGAGNIGVRRASIVFDRSAYSPADDDMTCHFDFLNVTGGAPDDTWTTGDFTTLEALLMTWWAGLKQYVDPKTKLREIRWYRHGPGVVAPNPVERTYLAPAGENGTGTAGLGIPQVACSITFRTSVRRSWGRTYLPYNGKQPNTQGRLNIADVDAISTTTAALVTSAASADFRLVVTSIPLSAALNVERIEVDDVLDVIRRRRWKHTGYRKILP